MKDEKTNLGTQALLILRILYASIIYLLISKFFPKYSELLLPDRKAAFPGLFAFLNHWPLEFLPLISLIPLFLTTMGTIFWPQHRLLRIGVFISFIFSLAVNYSQGRVDHQYHILIWIFLALCILPLEKANSDEQKTAPDQVFALRAAQAFILLFFFFQGFWKLVLGAKNGSIFWVDYLSLLIQSYLIFNNKASWLGDWLINHEYIGSFLASSLVIIQLASFVIIFFPKLYRLWGCYILCFLLSINIFMALPFGFYTFLVALFLLIPEPFDSKITIRGHKSVSKTSRNLVWSLIFLFFATSFFSRNFEFGDYRSAMFPLWSYKLFGAAYKSRTSFDLEIIQSGDKKFDPPISLMNYSRDYSSNPHLNPRRIIRVWGHFLKENKNSLNSKQRRKTIESLYFSHESKVIYRMVEKKIDLKKYWKTGAEEETKVLLDFEYKK